jgi:hypothetical protein
MVEQELSSISERWLEKKIIQFVSKEKLETERMIKEARARYESIFPTMNIGVENENDERRSDGQDESGFPES